MNKKDRAIKIQNSIRKILFEDWNPIGINDDGPEDEYDSYIGGVYRILASQGSEDDLINYLYEMEIEKMGVPEHNKNLTREVAKKLLNVNVKL